MACASADLGSGSAHPLPVTCLGPWARASSFWASVFSCVNAPGVGEVLLALTRCNSRGPEGNALLLPPQATWGHLC